MAKNANPFAAYDFTKAWGEFKLPSFDVDALVAAQKRNLEAVSAASQATVEGLQAAALRQAEIARTAMAQTAEATQEYIRLTKPEDKMAYQAKFAREAFESGLNNLREIGGIVGKATTEAVDVVTKRMVEGFDEFESVVANDARPAKAEAAPKAASK